MPDRGGRWARRASAPDIPAPIKSSPPFELDRTMPLLGGTIGLVGLGNIGMCVCKRLLCAGYRVQACEIREETVRSVRATRAVRAAWGAGG